MHVLEYDGELARLMNRKWLGQSWALKLCLTEL